jgi:hypothetical protein
MRAGKTNGKNAHGETRTKTARNRGRYDINGKIKGADNFG